MEVVLAPVARKQLDALQLTMHVRVLEVLKRLEQWPQVSGLIALRGPLAGFFRVRTGKYRVEFCFQVNRILVVKIGHRDKIYKE